MYKSKNHSKYSSIGEKEQVMTRYKSILNYKDNRHSGAKLKTYHFSGEGGIKELLKENYIEDYIEIFQLDKELITISLFPNGQYYIYRNAQDKELNELNGPYKSYDEAFDKLEVNVKSIWKAEESNEEIKNLYGWYVNISLTDYVDDYELSKQYLEKENMLQYYTGIYKNRLKSIYWRLTTNNHGYVEVIGDIQHIDDKLKRDLLDFIVGQNSDGLGEGFSEQDYVSSDYYISIIVDDDDFIYIGEIDENEV